ncbi:MAG: hypothetical protein IPG34_16580 [Rhodocyclaceae bacterium]|nr:hypothetical protein [Rhodocyclaceae bacterium]
MTTILGDAVGCRGGFAALTSLVKMAAILGLQDKTMRSAIYRLATEGVLESKAIGRRADYCFTAALGRARTGRCTASTCPRTADGLVTGKRSCSIHPISIRRSSARSVTA